MGDLESGPNTLAYSLALKAKVADFFMRPPTLTASNFAALWPTDLKFLAFKDLNPFSKCVKFQEATSILRLGFALSKWPHFDSGYLLGGPFGLHLIVSTFKENAIEIGFLWAKITKLKSTQMLFFIGNVQIDMAWGFQKSYYVLS